VAPFVKGRFHVVKIKAPAPGYGFNSIAESKFLQQHHLYVVYSPLMLRYNPSPKDYCLAGSAL
jgi:hypothetical protein